MARRILQFLSVMTMAATSTYCQAAKGYPSVDICQLLKNMDAYQGKEIALHSDLHFTEHGMHLFGRRCSSEGQIALNILDSQNNDKKVESFIKKIFKQHARGTVIIVGKAVHEPSDTWDGYFILQSVIEVDEMRD